MKKFISVLAVAASCMLCVAAGCGRGSAKNITSFASNWYYDSSYKRIQPAFTEGAQNFTPEVLQYKVTQTEEGTNGSYSVAYGEGEYTTAFYAKRLSKEEIAGITRENWRQDYLDSCGKDETLTLYYFASSLNIPVTFTCKNESKSFENSRVTESYFLSVEDDLRPVYTVQTVKSATPANIRVDSLNDSYVEVDSVYKTYYKPDRTELFTEISNNKTGEKDERSLTELDGGAYSVYDVAYLDVVARAMKMGSSLNQVISLYTPGVETREYTLKGSGAGLFEDAEKSAAQLAELQTLLEGEGLFVPGTVTGEDGSVTAKTLKIADVTVAYNGGSLSGVSQTYWFAAPDGDNRARSVMLKLRTPLTYSLGTLEYTLCNIVSMPTL